MINVRRDIFNAYYYPCFFIFCTLQTYFQKLDYRSKCLSSLSTALRRIISNCVFHMHKILHQGNLLQYTCQLFGEIKGQKCANCKSLLLETSFKRKHLGIGKRKVGRINGRVETGCASRKTEDDEGKLPLLWADRWLGAVLTGLMAGSSAWTYWGQSRQNIIWDAEEVFKEYLFNINKGLSKVFPSLSSKLHSFETTMAKIQEAGSWGRFLKIIKSESQWASGKTKCKKKKKNRMPSF